MGCKITIPSNFSCIEFDGSASKDITPPLTAECSSVTRDCEDTFNNTLCGNDTQYYQPFTDDDVFTFQTRFYDKLNFEILSGNITCPYYLNLDSSRKEFVQIPHSSQFEWGCQDEVSFEFWFSLNTLTNGTPLIVKQPNSSGCLKEYAPAFYLFIAGDGSFAFFIEMDTLSSACGGNNERLVARSQSNLFKVNKCHHFVVIKPKNAHKVAHYQFWLDGVLLSMTPWGFDNLTQYQCSLYENITPLGLKRYLTTGTGSCPNKPKCQYTTTPNSTQSVNDGPIWLGADLDCLGVPRSSYGAYNTNCDENWNFGANTLNGNFYSFRIYNRALTSIDISQNRLLAAQNCIGEAIFNPAGLVCNLTFNHDSGYIATDSSGFNNHGYLHPFASYAVPCNSNFNCHNPNEVGLANPLVLREFGYTIARTTKGGGAWLRHTAAQCDCCPEVPCKGVTTLSGCEVGEDFARVIFQINNTGLVFGAANQDAANVNDAALLLLPSSMPCPTSNDTIDPLLRLSSATDFTSYLTNIYNFYSAAISPSSSVTLTGNTFTFLLHRQEYEDSGVDVCEPFKLCQVDYINTAECIQGQFYEVAFRVTSLSGGGAGDTLTITDQYCNAFNLTLTVNSSNFTTLINTIVSNFNTVALGNSYAYRFNSMNSLLLGYDGVRFFFDINEYPQICDCLATPNFQLSTGTLGFALYDIQGTCCERGCDINEAGYYSVDLYVRNNPAFWSSGGTYRFELTCFGEVNADLLIGTFGAFTTNQEFITAFIRAFNSQYYATNGWYAMQLGDVIRVKVKDSNVGCGCDGLGGSIKKDGSNVVLLHENHCCQSDCETPSGFKVITFELYDSPSYEFSNANKYAWLAIGSTNDNCEELCSLSWVNTSGYANFNVYANAVFVDMYNFVSSQGGGSTATIEPITGGYRYKLYINSYTASLVDVCDNALQLCKCNYVNELPSSCVREFVMVVYFNPTEPAGAEQMYITFHGCPSPTPALITYSVNPVLPSLSITNFVTALTAAKPTWSITPLGTYVNGYGQQIRIRIPCDEFGCGCNNKVIVAAASVNNKATYNTGELAICQYLNNFNACNCGANTYSFSYTFTGTNLSGFIGSIEIGCKSYSLSIYSIFYSNLTALQLATLFRDTINSPLVNAFIGGTIRATLDGTTVRFCDVNLDDSCCGVTVQLNGQINGLPYPDGSVVTCCEGNFAQPFDLITSELQFSECCEACPSSFNGVVLDFEINTNTINSVNLYCDETNKWSYTTPVTQPTPTLTARAIANNINSTATTKVTAKNYGNILRVFIDKDLACNCEDFTPTITPTQNKVIGLYCCNTDSTLNTNQVINAAITQNSVCCPDYSVSIQLYDCCCNPIQNNNSLEDALECWSLGFVTEPTLKFFQNYRIKLSEINTDCFSLKFVNSEGLAYHTDCFKKATCEPTLLLCSEYNAGDIDCEGNIYGEPELHCSNCEDVVVSYSNCYRIYGELVLSGVEFTEEAGIKKAIEYYKLITPPLPYYVIQKIAAIANGANFTIDGKPYKLLGKIEQNIEASRMFAIELELQGEEICSNNINCIE